MVARSVLQATAAPASAGVAPLPLTVALAVRLRMVCVVRFLRPLSRLPPRLLPLLLRQPTLAAGRRVESGLPGLLATTNAAPSSAIVV